MLLDKLVLKIARFCLYALLTMPTMVFAQQDISVVKGDYEVFYSVFNTSFLSPENAKAIGVVRAENKAMLNLSIRKKNSDGGSNTVKARQIEGSTFDLIHKKALTFQEVVEPGAIYYLATFSISNNDEFIQLSAEIVPEGSSEPINLKFKRKFFYN